MCGNITYIIRVVPVLRKVSIVASIVVLIVVQFDVILFRILIGSV